MVKAVIQVRSTIKSAKGVRETLEHMRLHTVNHLVLLSENASTKGMLQKVKDYVTYGDIDAKTLAEVLRKRGRLVGNKRLTDEYVKANTKYGNIEELANAILKGEAKISDVKDLKPVFRLHPPHKGYEHLKRHYTVGGSLGDRGKDINRLIARMIEEERKKVRPKKE